MNIELDNIRRIYFVGIGGIGMSALARYFNHLGLTVAGYDSTPSPLTQTLSNEGIAICYNDNLSELPREFAEPAADTLIIFTPAVPSNTNIMSHFTTNGFAMVKRAKALGIISQKYSTAAVAGTHGKTSTSTLLAHLLTNTPKGCDAFLGGISKNFNSNLVLTDKGNKRLVVEADEFDRSFLNIFPELAIITSTDADHLDIYNTHDEVKKAFASFIANIKPNGTLIVKKGFEDIANANKNITIYTYSTTEEADFCVQNIACTNGFYKFDLVSPFGTITGISLGVLGRYNVENAVAASAAALTWGIEQSELKSGLHSFKGIARRFDLQFNGKSIYIDDYAHHPEELKAAISSAREMLPNRKITGIFQPHLYSRTSDFAEQFAQSLSLLDEVILLDIYPAREAPIAGVTSQIVFDKIVCPAKHLVALKDLQDFLCQHSFDVLLTMGAGNIDREVPKIVKLLNQREGK